MFPGPLPLLEALAEPALAETLPVEELAGVLLKVLTRPDAERRPSVQLLLEEVDRWHAVSLNDRPRLRRAVAEAWWWLVHNGLLMQSPTQPGLTPYMELTREGRRVARDESFEQYRQATAFPRAMLHSAVADKAWPAYLRGDFDVAVLQAFKAVEVAVRGAAKLDADLIGVKLMRAAFDKASGPLTNKQASDAERENLAHLFVGAIGTFKNPHSHRDIALSNPVEAGEMLMLASHLLRIVDHRRSVMSQ